MKIEVLTGVERRRRWRYEEKVRLVEETLAPGATVAEVARRYGVAQSVLFAWRRQARSGQLDVAVATPVLMPVEITAPEPMVSAVMPAAPAPEPVPQRLGVIEIDLGGGRRLRVDRDVDAAALRRVLGVLERR